MTDVLSTDGTGLGTTADDLTAVREAADRLLADHGVTYGAPAQGGDGSDADAAGPWRLDPVPVVLDEADWTPLDAALTQRAELLDAVLADLYGPRLLLRDDVLPPELVLAHPGFLRAVDGLHLPGGHDLVLTATDLCRTPDGSWVAVSDRTQAPSGAGYAMEDRRVVAQVLADVYRQTPIQRIGPFFHALRHALGNAAPAASAEPRAVLLSAGPASETAFDQAYLASMLGLPLVEGSDLVVREGRLWLRGLGGPEPVDVVLRRVDADWCDPLDLRSGSRLGVPGLVRAVQAGTVSVVNPLGSSVLENAGLLAHLPVLARTVLGADLLLPQAATTWCGRPQGLAHVLDHLDRLVLKPVDRAGGAEVVHGWTLDAAGRERLRARVAADPAGWVGQEPVVGTAAGSRAGVLRTFAVAAPDGYRVMAGGLARLAPDVDDPVVSHARGAVARDVWVLAGDVAPAGTASAEPDDAPPHPGRPPGTGLSPRSAESLFWLGRYTERADGTVRLLRAVVDRWDDYHRAPASAGGRALALLLDAAGARDLPDLHDLLVDRTRPGTVAWAVRRVAEAQAVVRDQMSADLWLPLASMARTLAAQRRAAAAAGGPPRRTDLRAGLDRMLEALLAVAGIEGEGLVRDVGWHLLDAGRRVERAQSVVATLAATVTTPAPADVESLVLESVLLAHESAITYRRRYTARPAVPGVLDLLLLDGDNPRSLAYQVARLRADLARVPAPPGATEQQDRLLADVEDLLAELHPPTVGDPDGTGPGAGRARLAEVLESLGWRLRAVADEVARVHFVHPAPAHAVAEEWGVGRSPRDADPEGAA
ncbi:circularly permuted type 2 ATP-grasp protein [Cellulomonas sp. Marseille-Q8402]